MLHGTKHRPGFHQTQIALDQAFTDNGLTGIGKTSCKDLPLHPLWEGVRSGAPRHGPGRRAKTVHAPRAMARKVKSLLHNVKDLNHQSPSDRQILSRLRVAAFDAERSRRPGGARRDRTDDLLLAKQALSQLSYGPGRSRAGHGQASDARTNDRSLISPRTARGGGGPG